MAFNWFKRKKKGQEDPSDTNETAEVSSASPIENHTQKSELRPGSSEEDSPAHDTQNEMPAEESKPQNKVEESKSLFARLKSGLSKTREILTTDIDELFSGRKHIDEDMLEQLEELLITSDIGVQTTMDLMDRIRRKVSKIKGPEELKQALKQEIFTLLTNSRTGALPDTIAKPHVVMVVGVNGVGKTTTIGKLAAKDVKEGKTVLIAAADTFRAAAVEQLAIWAQRAGADLVKHKANADPAAVAYDSIEAAVSRRVDRVFIDTAGRLHTKINLMEELKKIKRTISKKIPVAPHEIILVLDATTGQNALSQAKLFHEALGVTGLVLTKLDGTAKGGIVISICHSLNIPLHYVGVGESIEDLQVFDPHQFVEALF
jgi:fused signal recognition particle receptor